MQGCAPAIVLVAYGSLYAGALETYTGIMNCYQKEFYGSKIKLSFTSDQIRRKLAGNRGIAIPGPLAALADLHDQNFKDVLVQPLHIVPGGEFHETALLVNGLKGIKGRFGFRCLEMGRPLLSSLQDCKRVSNALTPILSRITHEGATSDLYRNPEEEAVVLVGHGSCHPGECVYSQMAGTLKRSHRNVFLGTLEGYPGIDDVVADIIDSGVKRVRLIPFLLVAGGHMLKDVAGEGEGSWRSAIEGQGFETKVHLHGLGDCEEIVGLLLEHTKASMDKMEERRFS